MMGKQYRLRPLRMCISRHKNTEIFFRLVEKNTLQVDNQFADFPDRAAEKEPFIESDLIVAAPGGVKLAPKGADFLRQALFDS